MQIQEEEKPVQYCIRCTWTFSCRTGFFCALGKIIVESGGFSSEALAKGSINGFLSGKNYKRCKRMHENAFTCNGNITLRKFSSETGRMIKQILKSH